MADYFTQCKMKKNNTFQTAWIPSVFAVKGKIVRLKNDNGWEVVETGTTVNSSRIPIIRDIYRHHRRVTDI